MPAKKTRKARINTSIPTLGPAKIKSGMHYCQFMEPDESTKITIPIPQADGKTREELLRFELAGPRQKTYFDPSKTKCAIVTCGGLCPGINDVIRAIVMEAHYNYKVAATIGIRYGLEGFIPKYGHNILELTPEKVGDIHTFGGTMLGSSRGPQNPEEIVDALERMNISVLFMVGGDGTMRAAESILKEVQKRKLKIAIIGIPKTIDNDISFVHQSFGFDTAVEAATTAIQCAHTEANGAYNGIGLVKLMGRESGFIAAQATLALKVVNFVLIPESPFTLEGEKGLLEGLAERLKKRHHAVIVVAEGAGQDLTDASRETDASGNPILGDIAGILRKRIPEYLSEQDVPHTLKYIDPSYIIRSVAANANDRIYCGFLGQHAVHAAMGGKTGVVISRMREHYIHLPLKLVTGQRRKIDTHSDYWRAVLESTGQFQYMRSCFGTPED